MTQIQISQIHGSVTMFTCSGFYNFLTVFNFIVFNFALFTFLFSRKRLATPFTLFKFAQLMYVFCLFNSLKDDCLSHFFESFDSFFFFRIARYFVGDKTTEYRHSFLSRYNQYDNMMFNLFDIYFYALILSGLFFAILSAYVFLIITNNNNEEWTKKIRIVIDLFAYSIPIKMIEVSFLPMTIYTLVGLYNSAIGDAGNIVITIVLIFLTSCYLLLGIFLLSTYFSFYIKAPFLRKYGALYSHVNFINFAKIVKLLERDTKDDYQAYKYLNMQRNHLNFEKIMYFLISYVIVYSQRSDGLAGLLILMVIFIIFLALYILLRVKNETFFYNAFYDYPFFTVNSVVILNALLLAVCSQQNTSVQFTSVFLMIVNIGTYIYLLVAFCMEIWRSQDKDLLWKLKINRQDKINKKDEFIKLLQAEVVDEKGRATDRRAYTKKTVVVERTQDEIRKSMISRGNRGDQGPKNVSKSTNFDFVMKKYKD